MCWCIRGLIYGLVPTTGVERSLRSIYKPHGLQARLISADMSWKAEVFGVGV